MKTLKKILIALLVLFGLYVIISFFIPSKVRVQRSAIITAPNALIFEQINNFHNWQYWSYWDNLDPGMKSTYEGPESGVGAAHSWTSNNRDVGNGSLKITKSIPHSMVLNDLTFEGMVSHGGWTIRDTADGAYVTGYMEMDMGFLARIFPGLMMDGFLGPAFESSLAGLKKRAEELKLAVPAPTTAIVIEPVVYKEQTYASVKVKTNLQNITNDISASYQKIGAFMQKNNVTMTGPVCAFYHSVSPDNILMEPAIPISKSIKGEGDIAVTTIKSGTAAVAHYYGSYLQKDAAYAALERWMKKNNKTIKGSPWEVYITDPMMEKDTSRWLTDVYYPIE